MSILDEVDEEGIVITKHGKPVAKLVPIRAESASLIGSLKGKVKIKGKIFSTGIDFREGAYPLPPSRRLRRQGAGSWQPYTSGPSRLR